MISPNDITFVIPVFNLKQHRLNNLKFVLPKLSSLGVRILVTEQIKDESTLSIKGIQNVEHLLYKHDSELIHKTGIINWTVKNHVKTRYTWVSDADFYMKFGDAIIRLPETDFVQPYSTGKKLSEEDSNKILVGESVKISYDDPDSEYISLYAALSFVCNTSKFIEIGGMDESIFGWGREDIEFNDRVSQKFHIEKMNYKGVHLYHPKEILTPLSSDVGNFEVNEYFDKIYCINLDKREDRWDRMKEEFFSHGISVERVSAIDGDFLAADELQHINPSKSESPSSDGSIENSDALGCLLTHLKIIKEAKTNQYNRILIFEDDVLISKKFHSDIVMLSKLNWKLFYLGASQFDWRNIRMAKGFYLAKDTYGTFSYAISIDAYDELIELLETRKKTVDKLLTEYQKRHSDSCYVMNPNIVISNVEDSDIRSSQNMTQYAIHAKWDLKKFPTYSNNRKKVLLVPDMRGWAFDNIASSILRYNPYPEKIHYDIVYAKDIHDRKTKIEADDYDLIYVMWEGERVIEPAKNVVRGVYSAIWTEHPQHNHCNLGKYISKCGGVIFANTELKNQVYPHLTENLPTEVIHDASDETLFYPINDVKNDEFTVLFVGNTRRPIKNFADIQWICKQANVNLKVCENIPNNELVHEYAKADVCINFSTFEGGPQTFVEAALCGIPMLIRNTNELSKLIPCFVGSTKEEFVDTLIRLKNNRDECKSMGKNAYDVAIKSFTYKLVGKKFADFFLSIGKRDLRKELTVFVVRSGENPNYPDCISAIENQNCMFTLKEIKDISPLSKALQQMIDRCETPYYIQVDEDMILEKNSVEKLFDGIKNSDANVFMVAYMLRDRHLDFNICGIKAYKHNIMVSYPYNLEIISCEKEQLIRMEKDGYSSVTIGDVVGLHSPKWTKELIYERYFDLMEKWKVYKYDWLYELPKKLMKIVKENPTDENIYALLGASMSISKTEKIRSREKNFLKRDESYENIKNMLG